MIIFLSVFLGVLAIVFVLRRPSWPMVVGYPVVWLIWSYYIPIPVLGGQPERLVAILGFLGVLVLLLRRENVNMPPFEAQIGPLLIILGVVLGSLVYSNFISGLQYLFSMISRFLFMYLTYMLIRTQTQIRLALQIYIGTSIFGAFLSAWASQRYGIGFARYYEAMGAFRSDIPPILQTATFGAQLGIVGAWLLLGLLPEIRSRSQSALSMASILFIFVGSILAQYRREVFLTVPIGLLFLMLDGNARIRRPAMLIMITSVLIYGLFFFSDPLTQQRWSETNRLFTGTDIRLVSLQRAWLVFQNSPIFGHGLGSYHQTVAQYFTTVGSDNRFTTHSFNAFAYFAVEGGILSVAGLVWILAIVFWQTRRWQSQGRDAAAWAMRCGPLLTLQIFIWYIFGNGWTLGMPWFWAGMLLAAVRITKEEQGSPARVVPAGCPMPLAHALKGKI